MNNTMRKLRELESKVAKLESRHISHQRGLSGFVDYIDEVKKDMTGWELSDARSISGYYKNLNARIHKQLDSSKKNTHTVLQEIDEQIRLYERGLVQFNKYIKNEDRDRGSSPSQTVYNSPFREADVVLRMSVRNQIKMLHDLKKRIEGVLEDLQNLRRDSGESRTHHLDFDDRPPKPKKDNYSYDPIM